MELLKFLQTIRTGFGDLIWGTLTHLGEETVFLAVGLLFLWCIDKKRGYYILFAGFVGTVLNQFLKIICRVPRPWVLDPEFNIVESARAEATGYSFPSGHTQSAASLFGGIALSEKKSKIIRYGALALILLVAFSRLYLGVHTPADVGFSLLLGAVLVFGLYPLMMREHKSPWPIRITMLAIFLITTAVFLFVHLYQFPADGDLHNITSAKENSAKLLGVVVSMIIVYTVDQKWLRYQTRAVWWAQILKLVGGIIPVILVKSFAKTPLNSLLGVSFGNAVRYFIIVIIAGILWPMTFRFFSSLGKKVK